MISENDEWMAKKVVAPLADGGGDGVEFANVSRGPLESGAESPRKPWRSVVLDGGGHSSIAEILVGSGAAPTAETMWPRYCNLAFAKTHFDSRK